MGEINGLSVFEEVLDNEGAIRLSYKIEPKTTTLSDITGLYFEEMNSLLAAPRPRNGYPESTRFFRAAHETKYAGVWHADAVEILKEADSGFSSEKPGKGYYPAIYFKEIKNFRPINLGFSWAVQKSQATEEFRIWLPPEGIIIPSHEGPIYSKVTGIPKETVVSIEEAVARLVNFGLTEDEARRELSMFYVNGEEGFYLVGSWSGRQNGPLCIDLKDRPSTIDLKHWFG